MSNISKWTNCLGNLVNENTLALASLNFDFSLYKVEAPREFQGLGDALSIKRRYEAEAGSPHRTARKLGALFDQVLPSTPELIKGYGRRVSEISRSQKLNPRGTGQEGPFAAHVGADGTAIWAAATSGPSAIPMLLLACMLARIWSGPEATSLWVDIVDTRRKQIEAVSDLSDANQLAALQAAQQELTRSELADWDASARAWLQTADEYQKNRQTQLMLIINNLAIPVSNNTRVYSSVIDSLKIALSSMEDLMNGVSQRVQTGALLLGLSAWHLYPDMIVHGTATQEILQADPLIPAGGILTLGLEFDQEDVRGVYWSLPLAHLRFYGDPIQSSRDTEQDASRITADMLMQVALGSLLSTWIGCSLEIPKAARWFACLHEFLNRSVAAEDLMANACARRLLCSSSWISCLNRAALSYLESTKSEHELMRKLIALGLRRYSSFLGDRKHHPSPMFGLSKPETLFPLLDHENERIRILRDIASNLDYSHGQVIIRYRHTYYVNRLVMEDKEHNKHNKLLPDEVNSWEYASALPCHQETGKRRRDGQKISNSVHKRWICMPWEKYWLLRRRGINTCGCDDGCTRSCLCEDDVFGCSETCACERSEKSCSVNQNLIASLRAVGQRAETIRNDDEDCISNNLQAIATHTRQICTKCAEAPKVAAELAATLYKNTWKDRTFGHCAEIFLEKAPWGSSQVKLHFMFGDINTAAIYRIDQTAKLPVQTFDEVDVGAMFERDVVNVPKLYDHFVSLSGGPFNDYARSLRGLATIRDIYKLLPGATVALSTASKPLHKALWLSNMSDGDEDRDRDDAENFHKDETQSYSPSLAHTFACIAMMESGVHNVAPSSLTHVFAVSSGNSIFVASTLLCDPGETPESYEVKRVIGNIGRAGTAMMIPPQETRIREVPDGTWQMINHNQFDGKLEDSFRNTSLHLSFTKYTQPINIGGLSGAQDNDIFFLESLVSVHDRDRWIADLDIFGSYRSRLFQRVCMEEQCDHPNNVPSLIVIDNWDELLEREQMPAIVMAHKNWVARLAIAAISVRKGYPTFVLPQSQSICWHCVEWKSWNPLKRQSLVYIC